MLLRLYLSVDSGGLPAICTVGDTNGNVLFKKKLTRADETITLNVCAYGIVIKLSPVGGERYSSARFIRTYSLPDCYCIRLCFAFRQATFLQNFYLYDKTYLLPVKYAALFFTEK